MAAIDGQQVSGVIRIPMHGPGDVSGVAELFDDGAVAPSDVVAIISQTEGWIEARALASLSLQIELGRRLNIGTAEVFDRIPLMVIGMVGGLMSPHHNVLYRRFERGLSGHDIGSGSGRLVIGTADSDVLAPEVLGTLEQSKMVSQAVESAIVDAGLGEASEVACVEVKCPGLTPQRVADAERRGVALKTKNPVQANALSRAASALGIGHALGELDLDQVEESSIGVDHLLYTVKGSVSAGGEQSRCRVVVMGNSTSSLSPYRIGWGIMRDQFDVEGIGEALRRGGMSGTVPVTQDERKRITQVFINCGADATDSVRGYRHSMRSDFLAGYAGIFAKTVAHSVVSTAIGSPMPLASAGWEHQGPLGGNLVAAVIEVE